tara:strand:- start:16217 stop:16564 length:348 start_codon:yes stop_codon:yes gene_type:complete
MIDNCNFNTTYYNVQNKIINGGMTMNYSVSAFGKSFISKKAACEYHKVSTSAVCRRINYKKYSLENAILETKDFKAYSDKKLKVKSRVCKIQSNIDKFIYTNNFINKFILKHGNL